MKKKQIADQYVHYDPIFVNIKPQSNLYIFVHNYKILHQLLTSVTSGVKNGEKLERINIWFYTFGLYF